MKHDDVWVVVLLAHFLTPFLAGLLVLTMVIIAKEEKPTWIEANDAALDLVILSIGATAPLMLEGRVRENLSPDIAVYGILLVLINLLIAGSLVGRKKWKRDQTLKFGNVWPDFFLGMTSVGMTTLAFYLAYNRTGGQHA